jgi:hypothetical protein
MGWKIMNHPPHSPDLAASDFQLFVPMKVHLVGQKFQLMMNSTQCPELATTVKIIPFMPLTSLTCKDDATNM